MPPRPAFLPRSIAPPPSQWTCHTCLGHTKSLTRPWHASFFHSTARRQADNIPNHYETLQLSSNATAAEIKRQFYTLSKQHHPDRNPDDPSASTRFVAISEAYHVLAVPEKRAQYDAQLSQSQGRSRWGNASAAPPQGSYSSAAFGSRPATGLNKKRSTFRGPPPSFYKSGGYGKHGAKRAEHAYDPHAQGNAEGQDAPRESYGDFGGGFGPGQQSQSYQVPHFDDRRHKQMHDSVNEHIWARRERIRRARAEAQIERNDFWMRFIMVTGVIGIAGITAKIFSDRDEEREKRRKAVVQSSA